MAIASDDSYELRRFLEIERSFILKHFPADLTLNNYKDILEKRFVYIGITEDLQGSVDQLASILGFPPDVIGRENVSPQTQSVPDGAREQFVQKHPLEYAIYRYALEHYKL